jgi:hypothetical protein
MATKAAASRASKTKVVARSSTPPKAIKGGFGQGSPLGVNARLGGQQTPGNTNVPTSAPAYETPGASAAVTPIAAPPVVTDPFLTPTDLASKALELADVDGYLSNVDLSVGNARIDAQQKLAAADTAEQRNLDAADWNTAARGLAQSSVRDTTKANLSSDAEASRAATRGNLTNANDYAAREHNRVDTVVKPAIGQKYDELAKGNAEAATDEAGTGDTAPVAAPTAPGAAPAAAPKPTAVDPGSPTSVQEQWQPVVKGGKFYHYYPSSGKYVFIRNAS